MIKKYETLYSKDSTGKIRIWFQEQDGAKYRTVSGVKDSDNLVTSEWTIAESKNAGKKNATTGIEQATAEINAKYKKQRKTGYTTIMSDVDTACNYIEPILAKNYKDYDETVDFSKEEWGMQTKFNGICNITSINGCFSRKGEHFVMLKHIEKALVPFFKKFPDAVLHGEAFNDDYREQLNEIVKLCRKTVHITEDDYNQSEKLIKYYIYDGYCESAGVGENVPYSKRKEWIDKNVIGKYSNCIEVKTVIIKDKKHLDEFFGERIERGDEGVILRKMNMKYSHKRDKNLLKYKPLDSDEMTIVDIKEGSGNWNNKAKIITLKMKNGKIFDGTFKGSMKDAEICLKEKNKWIGKIVTVYYNGITGLGCPQYCQFDYNNCLRVD
jgi:ATP-dependent DNA ligase